MAIDVLRSRLLDEAGFLLHGFTRVTGGVSEGPFESLNLAFDVGDETGRVAENLRRLKVHLDTSLPLARTRQVHKTGVAAAETVASTDWTAEPEVEADAIVSAGGAVAAVQTADCAAVLLADPETRVVAAAHAGWRGAASGVIRTATRRMTEMGARSGRLLAVIGPCICPECYEVGEEVARALPESADPVPRNPGKHRLDLANAVEVSLLMAGVPSSRIERIDACTSCETGAFFSFRRSGGTCGRMLGFIASEARQIG